MKMQIPNRVLVTHAYNPSILEVKAGELQIAGQHGISSIKMLSPPTKNNNPPKQQKKPHMPIIPAMWEENQSCNPSYVGVIDRRITVRGQPIAKHKR
jgi:hypothetical protein